MRLRQFFVVILFVFVILSLALVVTAQDPSQCVLPNLYMISWWPGEGNANDIYGIFPGTLIGAPHLPQVRSDRRLVWTE